ncbi:hypothetical protein MAPG_00080 [Magnaporthiopsis poae ATCC 64411]|uniref:Uncharacterized protein n=1 Tax=Magnaporthiopsis poae (strain ATCC 64411 / 73-15) TaxID=644358 RepID=A0A0C4DK17_MAGP6|nr:hypothetical protein MAPG_00080 [Magnaporthiopsis poae ATCC 64411]
MRCRTWDLGAGVCFGATPVRGSHLTCTTPWPCENLTARTKTAWECALCDPTQRYSQVLLYMSGNTAVAEACLDWFKLLAAQAYVRRNVTLNLAEALRRLSVIVQSRVCRTRWTSGLGRRGMYQPGKSRRKRPAGCDDGRPPQISEARLLVPRDRRLHPAGHGYNTSPSQTRQIRRRSHA